MPKHSYKQLEQVYQKGVNKEYKQNTGKTHPMSSRQGLLHQEMWGKVGPKFGPEFL